MQIIKDLIPFQCESVGSERIRKFLSLALIIGLLQTFSWTYQIVEAPKASAASTYAPSAATSITIPSGVTSISFTIYGGGGNGGLDCGAGCKGCNIELLNCLLRHSNYYIICICFTPTNPDTAVPKSNPN